MLSIDPDIDGFGQPADHEADFRTARTPRGSGVVRIHVRLHIDYHLFRAY